MFFPSQVNDTLNFFVTIEDEVEDAPVGGNNVVRVPVTVIVLDENDNPPKFNNVSPSKRKPPPDFSKDIAMFSRSPTRSR